METGHRDALAVEQEKAILVAALLPGLDIDPHDPLGELASLADTAGAVCVDQLMQKRQKPEPATLIGKGKLQELACMVKAHEAQVVLFENDLAPSQIKNIEQAVECKVLDRSELILDIFASRAQTYEARLQVELAQLQYTYPRLRAMWSHLERIGGGAPTGIGTRGPGEQQLEVDRRIVRTKIAQFKRQIADIQQRKRREVQHRNLDHYTVGLVGYTNAGKSTLFNTVTSAGTYADDKLFATLSTLTREWNLGQGDRVMLSDTVGFVRNLPHHLVASFKATLEEAIHADMLLIVLDVSDPNAAMAAETVMRVLDEIGVEDAERVVVLNKIDKLRHNADLLIFTDMFPDAVAISAKSGEGAGDLIERVRNASRGKSQKLTISVHAGDGKAIGFLESRTAVLDREYIDDQVKMTVRIGKRQIDQLRSMNTTAKLPTDGERATQGWGR